MATKVIPGLEGVAAAETRLSYVDGLAGQLTIGGHPLMELAPNATFEEAAFLLWHDRLPNENELAALTARFRVGQQLPDTTQHVLEAAAARNAPVIDALRMACATLSLGDPDPMTLPRMRSSAARRESARHSPLSWRTTSVLERDRALSRRGMITVKPQTIFTC